MKGLTERRVDRWGKQTIAGYWANLLVCTPTWRRVGVQFHDEMTAAYLDAYDTLSTKIGKADPMLRDGVQMLRDGTMTLSTEPDYVRAQNAVHVTKLMWRLYNASWRVLVNDTDTEYVTSDNPASFVDQGNWTGRPPPFLRYLPITPRVCLSCQLTKGHADQDEEPDFELSPRGDIWGSNINLETVLSVNVCTAKCAESLVFTGAENDGVRQMVAKYADFRVEGEFLKIPIRDGYQLGSRTRAIERRAAT